MDARAADAGQALIALCAAELNTDPAAPRKVQLQMQMGWAFEHMLGDIRRAAQCYEQALCVDPDYVPALRAARRAHLANNNAAETLRLFDAEMRLTSGAAEKAALAYEKGWWLEQLGEQTCAGDAYRSAVVLDPQHTAALKALERLASLKSQWDDVAALHGQIANSLSDPVHRAALLVARASLVEGREERADLAAELYESALKLDPQAVGALPALERIYHSTGRYAELVRTLERRVEQTEDPATRATLLCNVARVNAERLGSVPEAIAALEHARQVAPQDALILEDLARLYERAHRYEPLAEVLGVLAELAPEVQTRVALYHRLGRLYEHELERPQDAVIAYRVALRLVPTHVPSLQAVEGLLRQGQAWKELVSVWSAEAEAATSDSQRSRAHLRIAGMADAELKDTSLALAHYERALTLDPHSVPAFLALTRLYTQAGKHRDLIELYERALDRTTNVDHQVSYLFRVAAIQEEALEAPAQAAATYRRILKLAPDHLGAIHALAQAAERSGQYRDVVEALEMELKRTNDARHALGLQNRLGAILADRLGDADGAAVQFRRALEIEPLNETALAGLGRLHHAAGRWEHLFDTYRAQAEASSGSLARAELLFEMGEIAETHLARTDTAIACYRQAIETTPGHDPSLRALSRILRERGEFGKLAEILAAQAASLREPVAKARAHYRVGQVYEDQLGDAEAALQAYRAALVAHAAYRPAREALVRLGDSHGAWEPLVALLAEESNREEPNGAAALMRRAQVCRDRLSDRDRAITAFEALLARQRSQLPALLALEPLYAANARADALAKLYGREAGLLQDGQARLSALKELLRIQLAQNSGHAAARETLERIVELSPSDPLALSLFENIAIKEADATLRARLEPRIAALATDGRVAADHLASLAFHLEQQGQQREALEIYRTALTHHREHLAAIRGLGRTAEALSSFAALAEARSREAEFTGQKSHAADLLVEEALIRLMKLGDARTSAELLERALKLCPDHEPAARQLTQQLSSQGAVEHLVQVLANAANAALDTERVNALWAAIGDLQHQRLGNVPSAITALERALVALPDDVRTLARLADLYVANRQWNDAVRVLQKVVALALDEHTVVEAHLKLADVWSNRLDDQTSAAASLDAVIGLKPDHPEALGLLSEMQQNAGELDLALETARRLAEVTEGRARAAALLRMARIEHGRGNETAHRDALCGAVRLGGASGEAAQELRRIATTASLAKAYADALEAFIKATADAGADVASYLELARVQADLLQWGHKAIETLGQGLEATRGAAPIASELAKRLEQTGRHEDALKYVQQALAKDVTSADLWRALSANLEKAKRATEARLSLAALDALGCATDLERKAAEVARGQLAAPNPGSFGRQTLAAIAEGAMSGPALRLLEALSEPIAKLYPPDLASMGLGKRERIAARSMDSLRPLVDSTAARFGVPELELYATDAHPKLLQVLPSSPPTLVLSRQLEQLSENEQTFVVARAMAAIAGRFYPAFALPARDLTRLFAAVGHSVHPGFGSDAASHEEIEDLAQQLRKAFSWLASRKPLDEAAAAYVQAPVADLAGWLFTLQQAAARAALAAVGDLPAAMRVLRREAGESAEAGDPLSFVRSHPVATGLRKLWGWGRALQVWRHTDMLS